VPGSGLWLSRAFAKTHAPSAVFGLAPSGSSFLPYNFVISPDGGKLAFVALGPEGKTALWVRALSTSSAQQLTGTEGANDPFWSPDSLHVGFFAEGRLKSVDLLNSSVQTICDSAGGFGGTWNQDGVIVFAPAIAGPIYRVAATGGAPEAVTKIPPGSGESQHWPFFLPDGKHFLYDVNWSGSANARTTGCTLVRSTTASHPPWSHLGTMGMCSTPRLIFFMCATGPLSRNRSTPPDCARRDRGFR